MWKNPKQSKNISSFPKMACMNNSVPGSVRVHFTIIQLKGLTASSVGETVHAPVTHIRPSIVLVV